MEFCTVKLYDVPFFGVPERLKEDRGQGKFLPLHQGNGRILGLGGSSCLQKERETRSGSYIRVEVWESVLLHV